MNLLQQLPGHVLELLSAAAVSEFATVSAAGVPIDTPLSCFPSEDFATIDLATGLSYPAKAERARRNPKVGLLIEGNRHEPVVSIAGLAAVTDRDLQANALRYIRETAFSRPGDPPWELARHAVYYWTRLIIRVAPVRVLWWENRAAMEGPPTILEAAAGQSYPASDPAPRGNPSEGARWPHREWRQTADEALASRIPGHLTLCDGDGFPLPIRAARMERTEAGFRLRMPRAVPWRAPGAATLSFAGRYIFIGTVEEDGEDHLLEVERALPIHPFVADESLMWDPAAEANQTLMGRLRHEVARRGQALPEIPKTQPEPTELAKRRMARMQNHPG